MSLVFFSPNFYFQEATQKGHVPARCTHCSNYFSFCICGSKKILQLKDFARDLLRAHLLGGRCAYRLQRGRSSVLLPVLPLHTNWHMNLNNAWGFLRLQRVMFLSSIFDHVVVSSLLLFPVMY